MRASLPIGLLALVALAAPAFAPAADASSAPATVTCKDGSTSKAGRGACSKHGGVDKSAAGTAAKSSGSSAPAAAAAAPAAAAPAPAPAPAPAAAPAKSSTTSATKSSGKSVTNDPTGAIAKCKDGSYSHAKTHTGACSRHGGVADWLDKK